MVDLEDEGNVPPKIRLHESTLKLPWNPNINLNSVSYALKANTVLKCQHAVWNILIEVKAYDFYVKI